MTDFSVGLNSDGWRLLRGRKAFAATAGNGNTGAVAIANVTGLIEVMQPTVYCSEAMVSAGGGTITLGTAAATTSFAGTAIAAATLTLATLWDFYGNGAGPEIMYQGFRTNVATGATWAVAANIIVTVAVAAVSDGQLDFHFLWRPLSADGNLVLATGMTAI